MLVCTILNDSCVACARTCYRSSLAIAARMILNSNIATKGTLECESRRRWPVVGDGILAALNSEETEDQGKDRDGVWTAIYGRGAII